MLSSLELPVALPARIPTILRRATESDLPTLIQLLADDAISAARGDQGAESDLGSYREALFDILADPSNDLLVVVDESDVPFGTFQITRIPGMARQGSTRLLIEAVRVSSARRSGGVGGAMMRWVTDTAAPTLGVTLVQLTSDEARVDAHRFYERLGFVGSHRGFKFTVDPAAAV